MNKQFNEKNTKRVNEEKYEKLSNRRTMHKFQDRWRIMNIKYANRNSVTE